MIKKILNKIALFSLSLFLVVSLVLPAEPYCAAGVGFTNVTFSTYFYNQGQEFFGKAITHTSSNTTWNFYSYPGKLDRYNPNMYFLFSFQPSGSAGAGHYNLYREIYNIRFNFSAKNYNSSSVRLFNINLIDRAELIVNYRDGSFAVIGNENSNIAFYSTLSGGYTASLDISGLEDKDVLNFELYLYFDFEYMFGVGPDVTTQNSMDLGVGTISYLKRTEPSPPEIDDIPIPDWTLPEIDQDGLPDIDVYLPGGDNELFNILYNVVSLPPIKIGFIIISVLGVVSYVLFGKKG